MVVGGEKAEGRKEIGVVGDINSMRVQASGSKKRYSAAAEAAETAETSKHNQRNNTNKLTTCNNNCFIINTLLSMMIIISFFVGLEEYIIFTI